MLSDTILRASLLGTEFLDQKLKEHKIISGISVFQITEFKKGTEGTEATVRNYLDANANDSSFFQNMLLHLTFKAHLSKEILLSNHNKNSLGFILNTSKLH